MPAPFSKPNPLKLGGTIGIFSPSGALAGEQNKERLSSGVATLEAQGYRVKIASAATNEWRYFAGTDDERLASFHQMVADPTVDAMMMSRGGYGLSRLLHRIDWQAVAASRKIFCGFSDFTAFNCAALARANYITYSGPGAATDFDWRGDVTNETPETTADHAFMVAHCWPALAGERVDAGPYKCAHAYAKQKIVGPIFGSNLSLFSHLVGTPYMPDIEGGILFLEEIAEEPYAIERMLLQLFHAGILRKQRAMIFADFSDCEPSSGRYAYTMAHVAETMRELLPYPVLTGLPFGHVAKKLTIPVGAEAILNITQGSFSLSY
jgi:muramoyltetrapeptide carboxypeptidase